MIMKFYMISSKDRSTLHVVKMVSISTKNIYMVVTSQYCLSYTTLLFPFSNLNNRKFLAPPHQQLK